MAKGRYSTKDIEPQEESYLDKISGDVQSNQSKLSMVLGGLIILVVGILVFNYFNKGSQDLGPAQQVEQEGDVSPESLPGKYTVKEGDTLFTIAEKYYSDGYKYPEIATTNSLTNVDAIEVGQTLVIPKLAEDLAAVSTPSPVETTEPEETLQPEESLLMEATPQPEIEGNVGVGGADTTIWGSKIEGDTYTVVEGDWLSTIAARAYGDILDYPKIAEANNISNPDLILPGQVLKLPR